MQPETHLVVTARVRGGARLDAVPCDPEPPEPAPTTLVALARTTEPDRSLWIAGGEPTLRGDLPELIALVAEVRGEPPCLATDGLALAGAEALAPLVRAGLRRVRIALHSARPDAHDFLTGLAGSARRVMRAVRTCDAAGLDVEIEAAVSRVNTTHLAELAELAGRLRATALHLRRLVERGHASGEPVMLLPRLGLLEPHLEQAAAVALRRGMRVTLRDFPPCAAPGASALCSPPGHLRWLVAEGVGWRAMADALQGASPRQRCGRCPGLPACAGAPADYVARFGLAEFASEWGARADGLAVSADDVPSAHATTLPAPVPPPPPRAGRAPATRIRVVQARLADASFAGDALAGARPEPRSDVLHVSWRAPARVACAECAAPEAGQPEPMRAISQRLVRAAQEGASTLRVTGASTLVHPRARELLKECGMLSFDRVELACEGSALGDMSDSNLGSLAKLSRLDVALYGPDAARHDAHMKEPGAFASTLRGIERLRELTGFTTGAYAVLHDERPLDAWVEAWDAGRLPGAPAFRLAGRGGALAALAAAAGRLPQGPARRAIGVLLPPCLFEPTPDAFPAPAGCAFDHAPDPDAPVAGSDRLGQFTHCQCGPRVGQRCPGIAAGWAFPERAPRP